MISQVDGKVWRGPRPQAQDFASIKTQFAAVLSLEGSAENEKERSELAPVPVLTNTISFWEIYFTGISQVRVAEIMSMIWEAPKPLLVHCEHGQDRTGLVVATYRVMTCGWTKAKAMDEALGFGYRDWLNFGLNKTWSQV